MQIMPKPIDPSDTSSSVEVSWVTPDAIDMFWPLAVKYIQRSMEKGGAKNWSLEKIRQDLKDANKILWVGLKDGHIVSVAVTQVLDWEDERILHIYAAAGGHVSEWVDIFVDPLERYMEELDINTAQAFVRRGAATMLKKKGWQHRTTIMEYARGTLR